MTFTRRVEDFFCEKCGAQVRGDGYTNHCPRCLWSKHVDMDPGDRKEECDGMMEPTACEREGDEWILTHTCITCGHEKRNKMHPNDNFGAIENIAT
jgi:hypothetical protein